MAGYVGRGGEKLAWALEHFGVNPAGCVCADLGANVGGFTDALRQAGAARVYSVDTGYGTLDWKLRNDPCVVVMEREKIAAIWRHLVYVMRGRVREQHHAIHQNFLRTKNAVAAKLSQVESRLVLLASFAESNNPLRVLERGYGKVFRGGVEIHSATDVKPNDQLRIKMYNGEIKAVVHE